jgi:ABC-type multidrug transport system fused ATPase/permease subunit
MSPPQLMTRRRCVKLGLLVLNGVLQAVAALAIAAVGSRFLAAYTESSGAVDATTRLAADPDTFWTMTGGLILSSAGLVVLRVLQRRAAEAFALDYVRALRSVLFAHVLALPKSNPKLRYGLVMTRLLNDLSAVKLWLAYGLASLLVSIAVILPVVAFLALEYPAIAAGLIPGITLWALIVMVSVSPLRQAIQESRRRRGKLASFAGSALTSRLALQHLGRSGATIRTIERLSDRLNAALVRRATLAGLLRSAGELLYPAMILCLAVLIGSGSAAAMDAPLLGFSLVLTGLVAVQLNSAALAADYRLGHREAMRRIEAILSEPTVDYGEKKTEGSGASARRGEGQRLQVEHVLPVDSAGEKGARQSFTIDVAPGEIVWLDAQNAARRSRLFEMIAGLEPLETGDIRIEDISIRDADLRQWRRAVTLISPAIPLVRGSLDDNLLLGAPSSTTESLLMETKTLFELGAEYNGTLVDIRDDTRIDPIVLARIRAARGLLRSASIVLVDDPLVQDTAEILEPLIATLAMRGTTVLINTR